MKLHEFQAKELLARYGVPVPRGRVATSAREAETIAEELGGGVVVKAQAHTGGRGKGGGVPPRLDSGRGPPGGRRDHRHAAGHRADRARRVTRLPGAR